MKEFSSSNMAESSLQIGFGLNIAPLMVLNIGPKKSLLVQLPVISGSACEMWLEISRNPQCSGASDLVKCAHVTFTTQKKEA